MKRSKGMQAVWVVVGLLAGGCTILLGGDEDYHLGCMPGTSRCEGNTAQSCVDGVWQDQADCSSSGQVCNAGMCVDCMPNDVQCSGNTPQSCGSDGQWMDETACVNQTCAAGICTGDCAPGEIKCNANVLQSCDPMGNWQDEQVCSSPLGLCFGGSCIMSPPSCAGLAATCGPSGNESCCAITAVPGGTYNRSNDPMYPATVNDFRLDRFEITVGRFRAFVAAYPGSKPEAGAGAHPLIMGSGWDPAWDVNVPADQAALTAAVKCSSTYQTWTDAAGANENQPMNCMTWYEAFAFCAWDGGRLPTEAEWNYAAVGGGGMAGQREYPWSNPPSSMTIDSSYAVYDCTGDGSPAGSCEFGDILKVGSKSSMGDGKWGQADLAGSMWEWNLDWYESGYASTIQCNNCANVTTGSNRVVRGGSWGSVASNLLSSGRDGYTPPFRYSYIGARCARTP